MYGFTADPVRFCNLTSNPAGFPRVWQECVVKPDRKMKMTLEETKLACEGRDYWQQYVFLNGYAFSPSVTGLQALSRNLDITVKHLRKCINLYLSM